MMRAGVVRPQEVLIERRIFVGDIQGCLGPLERLLDAVAFRPDRDLLVPVGDLVNKGPDSVGVLKLLKKLGAEPVLGNHDLAWLRREGDSNPKLARWLADQPIVRIFDDVIAVHAGLHPKWKERDLYRLDRDQVRFATTVRYIDAKGNQPPDDWPIPGPPYRPWHDFYTGRKRVVFGHWARQGLVVRKRCIGLDTGAVYGGKLTAWIAEENRLVQVSGLNRKAG